MPFKTRDAGKWKEEESLLLTSSMANQTGKANIHSLHCSTFFPLPVPEIERPNKQSLFFRPFIFEQKVSLMHHLPHSHPIRQWHSFSRRLARLLTREPCFSQTNSQLLLSLSSRVMISATAVPRVTLPPPQPPQPPSRSTSRARSRIPVATPSTLPSLHSLPPLPHHLHQLLLLPQDHIVPSQHLMP